MKYLTLNSLPKIEKLDNIKGSVVDYCVALDNLRKVIILGIMPVRELDL